MVSNKKLRKWGHVISSGDIFEVPLSNNRKVFFQFILKDDTALAGHLLRAFNFEIPLEEKPIIDLILNKEIKFFAYTRILQGMKDKLWFKIGNRDIENDFQLPYFRYTSEKGSHIMKSTLWELERACSDERIFIGELDDITRKLTIKGVFPPQAIVRWLDTGWHGYKFPE